MRIAAIRYINALPLIFGLRKQSSIDLRMDTPSGCLTQLLNGTVDIALIPVFGTQLYPDLFAVPRVGIAAAQRTESVFVFARKPLSQLQSILVDPGSLTSVTLCKIILSKQYGIHPTFSSGIRPDGVLLPDSYDAALIIGDEAILSRKAPPPGQVYDLATEWHSMTGLPFIFAVWAALRKLSSAEQEILTASLEEGLANQSKILDEAEKMLPVDRDFLKRYYNHDLHYQLTPSDYKGLAAYLTLAADLKIVEKVRKEIWM
jgi:chorismate dehydratase